MPGWKFVTNHALVLCLIAQQPRITGREISSTISITEKATVVSSPTLRLTGTLPSVEREGVSGTGSIQTCLFDMNCNMIKLSVIFWKYLAG